MPQGGHTMPGMPQGGHTMPGMPQGAHDMPGTPQGSRGAMPDAQAPRPSGGSGQPAVKKPTATQYTCTMHPEIRSDKPGQCPKCSMKLVPVEPRSAGGQP